MPASASQSGFLYATRRNKKKQTDTTVYDEHQIFLGTNRAPRLPSRYSRRDKIPDFRWLRGKSFKDALEAVGRCSEGWEVAESNRGGIRLQSRGVQDQQALRGFRLALQNGDLLVKDEEGHPVPAEYWQPDGWWFWDGRLWSIKNNVRTVDYVAPQLVVPQVPEGLGPPVPAKSLTDTAQPSEETAQTSQSANDRKSAEQIIREYVRERERQGLAPNTDAAFKLVREVHPTYGRARSRKLYKDITKRDVRHRGRSHGKRPVIAGDLTSKKNDNST